MRRFVCALAFLTRAPLPASLAFDAADVGRAALWFPAIGALFGALAVGLRHALPLPPPIVALVIVIAQAFASGALHLDGLADMADGFGGGHTKEDVLRIMRDHAIGTYGACALVLLIGLKVVALTVLIERGADHALLLAPILARWPGVAVGFAAPYARREGGLGQAITNCVGWFEVAGATAFAFAAAVALGGVAAMIAVAGVATVQAVWCLTRIGGVTGDTIGANVEVCEALVYVLAC